MTATVVPNGTKYTYLQDPETRKLQYLEAIDFYLRETAYDIVFCENTGKNFFDEIESQEKYGRLEYLTFYGNDYDKSLGKGYGEARIIEYAIRNSQRLKSADFVIKITGRVKILNLYELAHIVSKKSRYSLFVVLELSSKDWAKSICFLAPKDWLLYTIEKYGRFLDDIKYNFEKMLYRSIAETRNMNIYQYYPVIDGICGFSQQPYENPNIYQRKLNHYNGLCHIYKSRGSIKNYLIYQMCWFLYVIKRKIHSWC